MRNVHYMTLIGPGRLIILRVPYPMPRWRQVLKAVTPLMHEQGLKQKDVVALEGTIAMPPATLDTQDQAFSNTLAWAFAGDPSKLPSFWLYHWENGQFVLARKGTSS